MRKMSNVCRKTIVWGSRVFLILVGLLFAVSGVVPGFYATPVYSQESQLGTLPGLVKKTTDLSERMSKARSEQVHILSPNVFKEAQKSLDDAKDDVNKGKDVKSIAKNLDKADQKLNMATRNTNEVKKQLPDLLRAREDALAANAPEYAPALYEDAEKLFKEAMVEIEGNNINGAIKTGTKAEATFLDAELNAIKASIIGRVHRRLNDARQVKADKYSPTSYNRSVSLIEEAEKILQTDRRAQSKARKKAEEAEYEANHAIYTANLVAEYRRDDTNWERLILSFEDRVRGLSKELQLNPRFDQGFESPFESLRLAVSNIKEDKQGLIQELTQKNEKLSEKASDLQRLSGQLSHTKTQETQLQEELEAEKRKEAKIRRVESFFAPSEAVVIRKGSNLNLRLVGLSFRPGKSEIEAQYFGLLTKVQRAVREFPGSKIVIEGHTDSTGNESINMQISNDRATAVKMYLVANMGIPENQILAVGYGEDLPVATNETTEGRSKNRRIDVVLEIGEANY